MPQALAFALFATTAAAAALVSGSGERNSHPAPDVEPSARSSSAGMPMTGRVIVAQPLELQLDFLLRGEFSEGRLLRSAFSVYIPRMEARSVGVAD